MAVDGRQLLDAGRADEAATRLDETLALWRGRALVEFESEPWAAAAAMDWSYRLLSAQEQVGFRCLATAPGPTANDCFRSVAAILGVPDPAAVLWALSQESHAEYLV